MPFVNRHANSLERVTHLLDQYRVASKELSTIRTDGPEVTEAEQEVIDRPASLQRQLLGKPIQESK